MKEKGEDTTALSQEAVTDLLTTLRPLVYKDGMCEDCHHDTEESAAIGQALLKWWSRHHIDLHPEFAGEDGAAGGET